MKPLLLALALSALSAAPALAQTVILARHAEKADASADPLLSEAGNARAQALASALAHSGVTHVFVTPLQRTRLTAGPAALASGVEAQEIAVSSGHVQAVADAVRAAPPEAVVLVVGHSNTIPAIARALGGQGIADMEDCEYDRLIVLNLDEATTTLTARYGVPSAC